jgi:phosphate transport system substrate-binding protein
MVVADNDQDNVDAIESLPGGFGACPVAQLRSENRRVRPLPLDGVAPTPAELLKGTYPHAKHLYVVTRESPSPLVKAFLDHLFSKAGRRVLTDLGYVPSKRK